MKVVENQVDKRPWRPASAIVRRCSRSPVGWSAGMPRSAAKSPVGDQLQHEPGDKAVAAVCHQAIRPGVQSDRVRSSGLSAMSKLSSIFG